MLDCPGGTFQGAGVKTVVLFFEKGSPTRRVWFYQLDPGRNLGKTTRSTTVTWRSLWSYRKPLPIHPRVGAWMWTPLIQRPGIFR